MKISIQDPGPNSIRSFPTVPLLVFQGFSIFRAFSSGAHLMAVPELEMV